MSDHLTWLVGTGPMSVEYAKVLDALGRRVEVVGRGAASAAAFTEKTGLPVTTGGVDAMLSRGAPPAAAIVSTGVDQLAPVTLALLRGGVRDILVEKPAGLDRAEITAVSEEARRVHARVHVGYNRRFYASVRRAREILAEDGGVSSFSFEFTEWTSQVVAHHAPASVKARWLLANSSHVIDLAFFLGGAPRQLAGFSAGGLPFHPHASAWAGAGVSEHGALFSYQANWAAPGRWGVEALSPRRRLILRPLEKLQVQKLGSVAIEEEPIDDALDRRYKAGLYRQVEAFFADERGDLSSIEAHLAAVAHFEQIDRPTATQR